MIMSLATMCGAYINDNETFGQDDDTSLQTIIRQKSSYCRPKWSKSVFKTLSFIQSFLLCELSINVIEKLIQIHW